MAGLLRTCGCACLNFVLLMCQASARQKSELDVAQTLPAVCPIRSIYTVFSVL